MFGISFPEFLVLGTVALLVLGPEKLPGVLRTLGKWLAKLRKLTSEVRTQSGIDDVLRSEGLDGGLNELRSLMRGGLGSTVFAHHAPPLATPAAAARDHFAPDKSREYPAEGADSYGALPEDLVPGFAPAASGTEEPGVQGSVAPLPPEPPRVSHGAAEPATAEAVVDEPSAARDAASAASLPPEGRG